MTPRINKHVCFRASFTMNHMVCKICFINYSDKCIDGCILYLLILLSNCAVFNIYLILLAFYLYLYITFVVITDV